MSVITSKIVKRNKNLHYLTSASASLKILHARVLFELHTFLMGCKRNRIKVVYLNEFRSHLNNVRTDILKVYRLLLLKSYPLLFTPLNFIAQFPVVTSFLKVRDLSNLTQFYLDLYR